MFRKNGPSAVGTDVSPGRGMRTFHGKAEEVGATLQGDVPRSGGSRRGGRGHIGAGIRGTASVVRRRGTRVPRHRLLSAVDVDPGPAGGGSGRMDRDVRRSEEHTSEPQSLMRT